MHNGNYSPEDTVYSLVLSHTSFFMNVICRVTLPIHSYSEELVNSTAYS